MKKSLTFSPVFPKFILIVVMSVLLLISTMTTVSAQNDTQESQQIEDHRTVSFSDNPQFQQGREFLDQAWIALENNDEEAAIHYFAMAEKHFSRALFINPNDVPILMNRATAYIGLSEYDLALEDLDTVLSLVPDFAPGYEGKAIVYEQMGDSEQAKEMQEMVERIYNNLSLIGTEEIVPEKSPPTPDGNYYSTWYASNARHSFTNRWNGEFHPYDNGFGCGVTQPWKASIENAVYFHLPWTTWSRNTQGYMRYGSEYGSWYAWTNMNNYLQGYTNAAPFLGWSVPNGENYVVLVNETEVCLSYWNAIPSWYKISAYSNYSN